MSNGYNLFTRGCIGPVLFTGILRILARLGFLHRPPGVTSSLCFAEHADVRNALGDGGAYTQDTDGDAVVLK